MKTLSIQTNDDNLYQTLLALLKQLPANKIKIVEQQTKDKATSFEQASDYVLKKNADLYKRLA